MLTHRFDTIIGDVPPDWGRSLLRELLTDQVSGDWGDDEGEVSIGVLRSTNFTNEGALDFSDVANRFFSKEKAKKFDVQKDDLLLERSGGSATQPVGRMGFLRKDLPACGFSNFVQLLRPDSEKINPAYLGWVLHEFQRSSMVERLQQQSTQMRNLNYRDYLRIFIPTPPRKEQEAIALVLHQLETAIEKANAELDVSYRLRTALMQQLFTRGIPGRHKEFTMTRQLEHPKAWSYTKLKKCGDWGAGGTPDRETRSYYEGSIPWVKSGQVNYKVITDTEEHLSEDGLATIGSGLLPVGTLLIAMYGAGVTRGRVALLGVPASMNQAIACFNGNESTRNEYLYYWFQYNYQRVRAWAAGSNQDNLSGYLLKNLHIALPEPDEQDEIVTLLANTDSALTSVRESLEKLMRLKKSLLQNLITGKVRVKVGK